MEGRDVFVIFFFGILAGMCFAAALNKFSGCMTRCDEQRAVEAGHAEYFLDKDHNRQWRWKEIK